MQVYTTKVFARFARRERIKDDKLCEAVSRAERRLIDADLGGGVISSDYRDKVSDARVAIV